MMMVLAARKGNVAFVIGALYAIRDQWRTGDRATAVVIAMLPAWLFLSVAVLWVGGTIERVLGIPGSSGAGTLVGVSALVAAGLILVGGPIWSLRRLSKVLPVSQATVRGRTDDVRVRGVNLGSPGNVVGCATFLVFVVAFLACSTLVIFVSQVYEALGGISPGVVRGFEDAGFWLGLCFMFLFPVVVTLWASPRIRRWIRRQAGE